MDLWMEVERHSLREIRGWPMRQNRGVAVNIECFVMRPCVRHGLKSTRFRRVAVCGRVAPMLNPLFLQAETATPQAMAGRFKGS